MSLTLPHSLLGNLLCSRFWFVMGSSYRGGVGHQVAPDIASVMVQNPNNPLTFIGGMQIIMLVYYTVRTMQNPNPTLKCK